MEIFFQITIDKSITTTPFALTSEFSHYQSEQEILFSMHTVFRIGEIKKFDNSNRLWEAKLTLTNDNDPLLNALTERMREETERSNGSYRIGRFLIKLGHFDKAEEVHLALLHQTKPDESEKAYLCNQFGAIKDNQGDYLTAISFYEKSLEIFQKLSYQMIPIWLLTTTTSAGCMRTRASTQKHFHFTKKH